MSERKNIERLFQEKFKDFEATPAPQVWGNIASKLEKKENKKRIIPFWLKASGIAASLVLGYFAIDTYTDGTQPNLTEGNAEKVVSSESSAKEQLQKGNNQKGNNQNSTAKGYKNNSSISTTNNNNTGNNTHSNQNNAVVSNEANDLNKENSTLNPSNSNTSAKNIVSSQKSNDNSNYAVAKNGKPKETNAVNQFQPHTMNQIAVTTTKHKKSNNAKSPLSAEKDHEVLPSYNENQSQSVAQNDKVANSKSPIKKQILNKDITSFDNTNKETQSQSVAQNDKEANAKSLVKKESLNKDIPSFDNRNKETQSQSIAQHNNAVDSKSAVNLTENTNTIDNHSDPINQNGSIASATKQNVNPSVVVAKDSVAVALAEENPLEKILKEKELQKNQEKALVENNPRWKIKPNVAPLFMNSSEGSPIDAQFADNSKKFQNKMSVGLGLDYALNSKISLRTGINQFDLGYNTNDIAFYADLNSKGPKTNAIKTINLRPDAQSMVIEDRKNNNSSQELAIQNKETGYINQRMGYVEVPIEVSYKILDRKFGVQFITGVSTLFLNDNQISVVSSGLTTVLGEANNLNKVHFSTNIGLGFKYTFWKSFEANFEPTFKYQINTFNDNSGGFKPYLIGLYSGLSFKF